MGCFAEDDLIRPSRARSFYHALVFEAGHAPANSAGSQVQGLGQLALRMWPVFSQQSLKNIAADFVIKESE